MYITSFFTNNGSPSTGLTPAITIYDLSDNSVTVNAASMSHVANGVYKYNFSTYNYLKEYAIYVDGGSSLSNADRYQYGSNSNEVWNSTTRSLTTATGSGVMRLVATYDDNSTDTFSIKTTT